ncbi:MAG: hypothetical protein EOO27_50320 [Comamonadaceae bacterium]|nr:MAG: hypothetical protein EOO27_50320 [Comamonadaceae bacterium]
MAAGHVALQLYDQTAVTTLNARGNRLRADLRDAGVDTNGHGSLIRILSNDTPALWWALYDLGVLAGSNGLLSLSTAMTDEQIDSIHAAVVAAATTPAVR